MVFTPTISEFSQALVPGAFLQEEGAIHNGRLLGLDVGTKRIGVALSDVLRSIATPLTVIERKNNAKDVEAVRALLREHQIIGLAAGLPMQMDGTEGESCKMVRGFLEKILKAQDIPIFMQDERFSTAAVNRALAETDFTRKKKQSLDDKMAASYILQGTLDRLKYLSPAGA